MYDEDNGGRTLNKVLVADDNEPGDSNDVDDGDNIVKEHTSMLNINLTLKQMWTSISAHVGGD